MRFDTVWAELRHSRKAILDRGCVKTHKQDLQMRYFLHLPAKTDGTING